MASARMYIYIYILRIQSVTRTDSFMVDRCLIMEHNATIDCMHALLADDPMNDPNWPNRYANKVRRCIACTHIQHSRADHDNIQVTKRALLRMYYVCVCTHSVQVISSTYFLRVYVDACTPHRRACAHIYVRTDTAV